MKRMMVAAVVLAVAAPVLAAQDDFHWTGTVAQGAAVEIKGVNGGITATAGGGAVEVTAVKKGRKSDPGRRQGRGGRAHGRRHHLRRLPGGGGRENTCAPGKGGP